MNILFVHEVTKLAGKDSLDNLENVITRISFKLKGEIYTPIVYEITKEFSIFLQPPIQDNFIPYSEISEENVISWIKSNKSYNVLRDIIIKEIEKKINPNNEVIKEFDFEEKIFPWVTPIVINGNMLSYPIPTPPQ